MTTRLSGSIIVRGEKIYFVQRYCPLKNNGKGVCMKKLLTFLLSAACCLTAFGFVACDKDGSASSGSESVESSTTPPTDDATCQVTAEVWAQTFTEAKFSNFKAELRGLSGESDDVLYVERDGNNAKLTSKDESGAIIGEWLIWQESGEMKCYKKNGSAYEEISNVNTFMMLFAPSLPHALSLAIAGDYANATFAVDAYAIQKTDVAVDIPSINPAVIDMHLECDSLVYAVKFKDGNLLSVDGTAKVVNETMSYTLTLGGAVVSSPEGDEGGNQGGNGSGGDSGNQGGNEGGGDSGNQGGGNEGGGAGSGGGTVVSGRVDESTWESQLSQENITHYEAETIVSASKSESETYYVVNGDEEYLEQYLDGTIAGRYLAYTVNGEIVYYLTDYDIAGDDFIEDTSGNVKRSLASQRESFDIIVDMLATKYATAQYMEKNGVGGYVVTVDSHSFVMSGMDYTLTDGDFVVLFEDGELCSIEGQCTMSFKMAGTTYSSNMTMEMSLNSGVVPSPDQSGGNQGGGNEDGDSGNQGGGNEDGDSGNQGGGNEGGDTPAVGEVTEEVWREQLSETTLENFSSSLEAENANNAVSVTYKQNGDNIYVRDDESVGTKYYEVVAYEKNGTVGYYYKTAYGGYYTVDTESEMAGYIASRYQFFLDGFNVLSDAYAKFTYNSTMDAYELITEEWVVQDETNGTYRQVVTLTDATFYVWFEEGKLVDLAAAYIRQSVVYDGDSVMYQAGPAEYSYKMRFGGVVVEEPALNPNPDEGGDNEGGNEGGDTSNTGYITEDVWQEQLAMENFENLTVDCSNVLLDSGDSSLVGTYLYEYKADGADAYMKQIENSVYQSEIVLYNGSYYVKYVQDGKYALTQDTDVAGVIDDGRSIIEFPLFVFAQQYANAKYDEELDAYVLRLDSLEASGKLTMQDVEACFYFDEETQTLVNMNMVYSLSQSGMSVINKYQIAVVRGNAVIEQPEVDTDGGDSGSTGGDSGSTGGDSGSTGGDSGSTGGGNEGGDVSPAPNFGEVDEKTWQSQLVEENFEHYRVDSETSASGSTMEVEYIKNGNNVIAEFYFDGTFGSCMLAYETNGKTVYYMKNSQTEAFKVDETGNARINLEAQGTYVLLLTVLYDEYENAKYNEDEGAYILDVRGKTFVNMDMTYTVNSGTYYLGFVDGELYAASGDVNVSVVVNGNTQTSNLVFSLMRNVGVVTPPDEYEGGGNEGGDEGDDSGSAGSGTVTKPEVGDNESDNEGGTTVPEGPLTQEDWNNQLAEDNFKNFVAGFGYNDNGGDKTIYNRDGDNEQYERFNSDGGSYGYKVCQMGDSLAYFAKEIDSNRYVESDPVYIVKLMAETRAELIFLATLVQEYFYLASYDIENEVYRIQLSNVSKSTVIVDESRTYNIVNAEFSVRLVDGRICEISAAWNGNISYGQEGRIVDMEFSVLFGEGYVEAPELEGETEMPSFELEIPAKGNEVSEEVWNGEMVQENFDNFAAMLVEGTVDSWTGLSFERNGESMYQANFYNGVLQDELLAEKLISSIIYYYDNRNGHGYQKDSTTETKSRLEESSSSFTMLSLAMVGEYSNLSYDAELGAYTLFVESIPMGAGSSSEGTSYTVTLENVTYYFVFVGDKLVSVAMNGELISTTVSGTNTSSQDATFWYQLMMDYATLGIPEFTPEVPAGGDEVSAEVWEGQLTDSTFENFTATGDNVFMNESTEITFERDGENMYEKDVYDGLETDECGAYNDGNGVVYYYQTENGSSVVDTSSETAENLASALETFITMSQLASEEWENAVYDENTGAYTLTIDSKLMTTELVEGGSQSMYAQNATYTLVFEEGELVYIAMELEIYMTYNYNGYTGDMTMYMSCEITFGTGSVSAPVLGGGSNVEGPSLDLNVAG